MTTNTEPQGETGARRNAPVPIPIDDPLLNTKQIAAALGVSVGTVWKWRRTGYLPTVEIGIRKVLIPKSALEQFLAGLKPTRPTELPH